MMSAESDGPLRIVAVAVSITNSSLGAWVGELVPGQRAGLWKVQGVKNLATGSAVRNLR
jgi:hypothetical protein